MRELVSVYRGKKIWKLENGQYQVDDSYYRFSNSWNCIVHIDEVLSP